KRLIATLEAHTLKEPIRNKAKRLFLVAILGLIPAIVTPFVLNSVALNLQEMLGRLFRVGFEGGILILFGEIIVGWPLYAAVLYFIFSRCGFFISDNDNKSLSLFR